MSSSLEERLQGVWHQHLERLKRAEEDLSTEEHGLHYSVPRIVAIGEESSGKSSTLERLAMLECFPSDMRMCTRMPIELRLRYRPANKIPPEFLETGFVMMSLARGPNSSLPEATGGPMKPSEVETQVRTWMEDVVREQNTELVGITEDRLVIELYSLRKLNLDLIDLPGIVAGALPGEPSNIADKTRAVTSSFLDDPAHPHTFVIVVVPATLDRVRNSQAMELVQKFRKEGKTIGALTKADQPHAVHLRERLTGASDCPELGLGYVALVNRDTSLETRPGLEEANSVEAEWFAAHWPEVSERCGIRALTDKIVDAIESYTANTWYGLERERLLAEREKVRTAVNVLGTFIPSSLDELIAQTRKLLPEADKIWTYYAIEECAASHCRVADFGNLFSIDLAKNGSSLSFHFDIASQQTFMRSMNGWTLHSEQILACDGGAGKPASSPPSSPDDASPAFVFGDHNAMVFGRPRRSFRRVRRPRGAPPRREETNANMASDPSSDEGDAAAIVSFFKKAVADVPAGQLIFCGEQVSIDGYFGIYTESSKPSAIGRHTITQYTANGSGRSFYLDAVGSAAFSEKLESFCLQAVARGPGPYFDTKGFAISGEALGLPSDVSKLEVLKCFFGSGWKDAAEQKFVVMTFPAVMTLTANPILVAQDPYEMTAQTKKAIFGMVENTCRKVITEHVKMLLVHLKSCDKRFPTFQAALAQVLVTWDYNVTSAVFTRMDSWLQCFFSRGAPSSLPIPTAATISELFSQAQVSDGRQQTQRHHTFCNPLTIALSMTLHEQLQAQSLTEMMSSESFKNLILEHETESALIRETCAVDRDRMVAKVEAITGMLNVMNEVFVNHNANVDVNDVGVN